MAVNQIICVGMPTRCSKLFRSYNFQLLFFLLSLIIYEHNTIRYCVFNVQLVSWCVASCQSLNYF